MKRKPSDTPAAPAKKPQATAAAASGSSSFVSCPICSAQVAHSLINMHVDECMSGRATAPAAAAASQEGRSNSLKAASLQQAAPVVSVVEDGEGCSTDVKTPAFFRKRSDVQAEVNELRPLAERVRPTSLEQIIGQDAHIGPHTSVGTAFRGDKLCSMILWGPPGCGKTTFAQCVGRRRAYEFVAMSAVSATVKDVRDVMDKAKALFATGRRTVLFLDEIHRFNKLQQDAFLPSVESGSIILLGATTENPSFSCNSALLSRCRVVVFSRLSVDDLLSIFRRAVVDECGLGKLGVRFSPEALTLIASIADGDARVGLRMLEQVAELAAAGSHVADAAFVKASLQKAHLQYDGSGDQHYDIISAFQKSIRGSDADAAMYWLARMVEGGEDPKFISRRLMVIASEDVGLADPQALVQAVAAAQTVQLIGMPEARLALAQCTLYMCAAPKSVDVLTAYSRAAQSVNESSAYPVPIHLRNAPTQLAKSLGFGREYIYPPSVGYTCSQPYLPHELAGSRFYIPTPRFMPPPARLDASKATVTQGSSGSAPQSAKGSCGWK